MNEKIRTIYLYFFSFLGLILIIIGGVRITEVLLRTFVFTEADKTYQPVSLVGEEGVKEPVKYVKVDYEKQKRHRDYASSFSLLVVGLPLYLYHRKKIKNI